MKISALHKTEAPASHARLRHILENLPDDEVLSFKEITTKWKFSGTTLYAALPELMSAGFALRREFGKVKVLYGNKKAIAEIRRLDAGDLRKRAL